jgi:hypothetical protein
MRRKCPASAPAMLPKKMIRSARLIRWHRAEPARQVAKENLIRVRDFFRIVLIMDGGD